MARSRNIKPGFFKNDTLVELEFGTRLLFAGLWTLADREGRLEDRPKKIKMEIFPADSVDVDAMLTELHESRMILRYEVEGVRYIEVTNFVKHQNPHPRESASTIPAPREYAGDEKKSGKQPASHEKACPSREKDVPSRADSLISDSLQSDSPSELLRNSSPAEPDAAEVIGHLNHVTGSKFQKRGKSLEHVRARLREGNTVGDLCAVVDFKHREWSGTGMAQYLRPETLFQPGKFPGYLAAAREPPRQYSDTTAQNVESLREWANGN